MTQTVEVRFKGNRRGFYDWEAERDALGLNEPVLVEAERGLDFGWVNAVGDAAANKCGGCTSCGTGDVADRLGIPVDPEEWVDFSAESSLAERETSSVSVHAEPQSNRLPESPEIPPTTQDDKPRYPRVVRRAASKEVTQHEELRKSEEDARRHVVERATFHKLVMRVSDAEWQWDKSRLTVYFTAERRVDFRALVRELASHFHARIDLRQVGVRDESARLGGIGRCGREFCCSTWLNAPGPVNLALAKDQHLSLNPTQISGGCGRLLCCLRYEHEFYVQSRKRFPKEGKSVVTLRGTEKVVAVDIFRERVFLRSEEHGPRIIPLLELRDEIERAENGEVAEVIPAAPATPGRPRSSVERAASAVERPKREAPAREVPKAREAPPREASGRDKRKRSKGQKAQASEPAERPVSPREPEGAAAQSAGPDADASDVQPEQSRGARRPRRRRRRRRGGGGGGGGGEKGGSQ